MGRRRNSSTGGGVGVGAGAAGHGQPAAGRSTGLSNVVHKLTGRRRASSTASPPTSTSTGPGSHKLPGVGAIAKSAIVVGLKRTNSARAATGSGPSSQRAALTPPETSMTTTTAGSTSPSTTMNLYTTSSSSFHGGGARDPAITGPPSIDLARRRSSSTSAENTPPTTISAATARRLSTAAGPRGSVAGFSGSASTMVGSSKDGLKRIRALPDLPPSPVSVKEDQLLEEAQSSREESHRRHHEQDAQHLAHRGARLQVPAPAPPRRSSSYRVALRQPWTDVPQHNPSAGTSPVQSPQLSFAKSPAPPLPSSTFIQAQSFGPMPPTTAMGAVTSSAQSRLSVQALAAPKPETKVQHWFSRWMGSSSGSGSTGAQTTGNPTPLASPHSQPSAQVIQSLQQDDRLEPLPPAALSRPLPSHIKALHDDEVPTDLSDVNAPASFDSAEGGPFRDAFFDARSTITGVSAAPPPAQSYRFPPQPGGLPFPSVDHGQAAATYQDYDPRSRQEESVLSFGSLGPPTELVVAGVVAPDQQHLPANFDVFHAINMARTDGAGGEAEAEAQMQAHAHALLQEERRRTSLLKYHQVVHGEGHKNGSVSTLSIGAEGIDTFPQPPGLGGGGPQYQYATQQRQPMPSSRNGGAGGTSLQAHASSQPSPRLGGQYYPTHRYSSNGAAPPSPPRPQAAHPHAAAEAPAQVQDASQQDGLVGQQSRLAIDRWRLSVKPPPVVSPSATAILTPSNTLGGGVSGLPSTGAQSLGAALSKAGQGHAQAPPSSGAPSTVSYITIHGGALAPASPVMEDSPASNLPAHLTTGYGATSASRNSGTGSGSDASSKRGGQAGEGARTPTMASTAQTQALANVQASWPPGSWFPPSKTRPRQHQHHQEQAQQAHTTTTTTPGSPGTQRVHRPPALPMSADGAPPKFGSISSATIFSGFTELTSVSRR